MALAFADIQTPQRSSRCAEDTITPLGVLLVHRWPLVRAGLRSRLESEQDMEVVGEASDVGQALAWTQHPDVVLLDGDLTGNLIERVDQFRRAGVSGILVMTASPDEETLFRLLQHGASAYERSHISVEDLLAKIRRVAHGECVISGEVLLAQGVRREPSPRKEKGKEQVEIAVPEDCPLSRREREVLAQIAAGRRGQQIKEALCISEQTVKNYLTSILKKLAVSDRTAAVALALHHHWIDLEPASGGLSSTAAHRGRQASAEQARAACHLLNR